MSEDSVSRGEFMLEPPSAFSDNIWATPFYCFEFLHGLPIGVAVGADDNALGTMGRTGADSLCSMDFPRLHRSSGSSACTRLLL